MRSSLWILVVSTVIILNRVGGAIGTNIDPKNCPRGTGANAPADKCTGAW